MIRCESCDEVLVEAVDVTSLTVRGQRVPFRRSSDYVACETCGALRSVRSLRAELVAGGHIDADAVVAGADKDDLRDVLEEALEEVRANARESSDVDHETVDAAFALLHDLAGEDVGEPTESENETPPRKAAEARPEAPQDEDLKP